MVRLAVCRIMRGIILTSYESITNVSKLQKIDYMFHISNLLFVWHHQGLSQESREDERLFDCRCSFVNIHLFAVAGGSLKTNPLRPSVDQD